MKIYSLHTGFFKLDGGAMFGLVPKVIWGRYYDSDDKNRINLALRCYLIEHGKHLILFDSGIGDKLPQEFLRHYDLTKTCHVADAIKKHNFHPDQVTDVILTHLHFDHSGGATKRQGDKIVATFPNAKYWVDKKQWEWSKKEINPIEKPSYISDNLEPLSKQCNLNFVDDRMDDMPAVISFQKSFGHTESLIITQIKYKEHTLLFPNDLIPTSFHLPTNYFLSYDIRPLVVQEEKIKFLEKAYAKNAILFFPHDPHIEGCNLLKMEKGYKVKQKISIEEL